MDWRPKSLQGEVSELGAGAKHALFIAYSLEDSTEVAESYFPKGVSDEYAMQLRSVLAIIKEVSITSSIE
jgi:hypothetical protein